MTVDISACGSWRKDMTGIDKSARLCLSQGHHSPHHRQRRHQAEDSRRSIRRIRISGVTLIGVVLGVCVNLVTAKPDTFGSSLFGKASSERYPSYFDSHEYDFDPDEHMDTVVNIIVAVAIFVFVAIFAFLLCLCCPICILAKMRSRRRGVVYRSTTPATNGTTVTTERTRGGGTVITVSRAQNQMASPAATQPLTGSSGAGQHHHPQLIAIPNNSNQAGKPYPVQESVTVVPLIQPQPQPQFPGVAAHGYHQQSPYAMPTTTVAPPNQQYPSSDLPPPYPGLPRDMDPVTNNHPYNPYYTEETASPSAPILKH